MGHERWTAGAGTPGKRIRTTSTADIACIGGRRSSCRTMSIIIARCKSNNLPDSGDVNAVANDTYPACIWTLYSTWLMTCPMTATSRSHSPSTTAPSISFCILPFALDLGSMRWHSPTLTADTNVRGPLPPTAWKYVWLPNPVDNFAGSERDRFRTPPMPENVTASKNSLNAKQSEKRTDIVQYNKQSLTFCWCKEHPQACQNTSAKE
jgi:hypothetical protein